MGGAGTKCLVERVPCLANCARGPNMMVERSGKRSLLEGVESFKLATKVLEKYGGVNVDKATLKVCEITYDARRQKSSAARTQGIKKAMDELNAATGQKNKRLLASLHAMRASESIASNAADAALKDVQLALDLVPDWSQAYLQMGRAYEAMNDMEAMSKAVDNCISGENFQAMDVKELSKLQDKLNEEEEKKRKAEEEARRQKEKAEKDAMKKKKKKKKKKEEEKKKKKKKKKK